MLYLFVIDSHAAHVSQSHRSVILSLSGNVTMYFTITFDNSKYSIVIIQFNIFSMVLYV